MTTDLYSAQQAADLLGVTRAWLTRLAEQRGIGTRIGSNSPRAQWVFTADEIEAMRERKTTPGPAPRDG